MPMSSRMRLRTVAKTGRLMQSSESDMAVSLRWRLCVGRHDLDIGAVAQARLPGDHHLLAGLDALDDLDEAAFAASGHDLGLVAPCHCRRDRRGNRCRAARARFPGSSRPARQSLDGDAGEKARAQLAVADCRAVALILMARPLMSMAGSMA